jgi:hypothetical protein
LAEDRERITRLLKRPPGELSPTEWRAVRAVQVLERVGTSEARTLLAEWASEAEVAVLTVEAKQAVARMVTAKAAAVGGSR